MSQLSRVNKSCTYREHKDTHGPIGLYELFLLPVPTEEVAHW